ncbi:hypothetical protein Tco_0853634 [Tanacetum coccineum]
MSNLKYAETHNLVAFLEKPKESDGFEGIIDFLNASSIRYALTVKPTIYTSCIKKFWTTAKAKSVNEEMHMQALVDGKKVIVTETSVRRALQLKDAEGTECLLNATIFEQLTLMGAKTTAWNEFSSTMTSAVICLATNKKFNFSKYIFDNMGKDFSGRDTPLFPTMIVQAQEQKQSRRKQRKDNEDPQLSGPTQPITDDTKNVASVPTHSDDPLLSGEDRLKLNELMVKKLEKKGGLRTHRLRRLYKVSISTRVVSSEDEGLGDQEDAFKQGRKIDEIDQDAEVTLVDETQGRYGDNLMFDTSVLDNEQDMAEKEDDMAEKDVSIADPVTTAGEVVTTANVVVSTTKVNTNRQGSGNIDMTPTMPHDSPLLRVNTLGSDEGSMTLQELMVFCTTLSKKVESLETDLKQTKLTYGAAYTKLIKKVKKLENKVKSSQARRRARIIVSDDEDDLEDPSKQGKKIAEIDQDPVISLVQHNA